MRAVDLDHVAVGRRLRHAGRIREAQVGWRLRSLRAACEPAAAATVTAAATKSRRDVSDLSVMVSSLDGSPIISARRRSCPHLARERPDRRWRSTSLSPLRKMERRALLTGLQSPMHYGPPPSTDLASRAPSLGMRSSLSVHWLKCLRLGDKKRPPLWETAVRS